MQLYKTKIVLAHLLYQEKPGWLSSLSDNLVIYVRYFHGIYPSLGNIAPSKSNYRAIKPSELA
jgi:hypothetical protein